MSQITTTSEPQYNSPFDVIRGYRADGTEYWTGRELLKWLGYAKWENAEKAIKRVIKSLENQKRDITEHLLEVGKLSTRYRGAVVEINDYELSRFGCYLVAMNADPEKEMVALAQGYFADQARKAEVLIPAQNDRIRELELQLQLSQSETQRSLAEKAVLDTRHLIVCTCPELVQQKILGYQVIEKIEYRDRIIHQEDVIRDGTTINKTALCHRYGLLKAGKPQYKQLNQLLEKLPEEAFRLTATLQENRELDLAFLSQLDNVFQVEIRQLNLGE